MKLILGDCLDVMKTLPDKSVDAVFADPPYGVGIDYGFFDDTPEKVFELITATVPEMRRVAKAVFITCGQTNIWKYPPADWVMGWFYGTTNAQNKSGFTGWQPILFYGNDNYRARGMGLEWTLFKTLTFQRGE